MKIPFICNYLFSLWSLCRWKRLVTSQCRRLTALEHKNLLYMPRTTLRQNKIVGTSKVLCEQHSKCSLAWICIIRSQASLPTTFPTFSIIQPLTVHSFSFALPNPKLPQNTHIFTPWPQYNRQEAACYTSAKHVCLLMAGWCPWAGWPSSGLNRKDNSVLAFPFVRTNLACLSTPMPLVFMDHVGISCLWDLYLQSYLKWAEGSPKFSRGILADRCMGS